MQDTVEGAVELIREALARGHAVILPADASPRAAAANTGAPLVMNLCLRLGLVRSEARVLAALMGCDHATREQLHAAMSPDSWAKPNSRSMDVTMCGLRKKLSPHGIGIVNVRGLGFALAQGARDKLHKILAEHGAEPAAQQSQAGEPDTKSDVS